MFPPLPLGAVTAVVMVRAGLFDGAHGASRDCRSNGVPNRIVVFRNAQPGAQAPWAAVARLHQQKISYLTEIGVKGA